MKVTKPEQTKPGLSQRVLLRVLQERLLVNPSKDTKTFHHR